MQEKKNTLRIKKMMVAILSVLLVLTLVTTISFSAPYEVMAAPENTEEQAPAAEGTTEEKAAGETAAEGEQAQAEGEATEGKPAEGEAAEGETAQPETTEEENEEDDFTGDPETNVRDTGLDVKATMPEVTSSSYIVMSGSTSEVIIEENANRKMSPGKITMLMNAMVVLDNMHNENELEINKVEITEDLAEYGDTFKVGESVSVGDLLYAMLVGGDEQAAEALASYSASKRKVFISEMNSKAMELGLMDTQFSNPKGSYSTKHYSSAADCAVIVQAAMRYQVIKDALLQRDFTATAESKDGDRAVKFRSTNQLLVSEKPSEKYGYTKGAITGTLGDPVKATQYGGVAVIDDMQLIVILMDSKESKVPYEAKHLFEYADTIVTKNVVIKANKKVGHVRVRGGASTRVSVYTETKGFAYVPPEGSEDLVTTQVYLEDGLEAPLKEGDKVGEYRIFVADELKGTVDLVIRKDVPVGWLPSRIYISNRMVVLIGILLLLVALFFIRVAMVKRRKQKVRELRRQHRIRELAMEQLAMDEDRAKRNWDTKVTSYDKVAPRTGDLRKEAEEADSKKSGKKKNDKTGVEKKKTESIGDKSKTDNNKNLNADTSVVKDISVERVTKATRDTALTKKNGASGDTEVSENSGTSGDDAAKREVKKDNDSSRNTEVKRETGNAGDPEKE